MSADAWATCEFCGARMKHQRLEAHIEEVHPSGARSPEERAKREARRGRLKKTAKVAAVVVGIVALVGLAVVLIGAGNETAVELSAEGEPYLGQADAPLTVYLFEDYKCPFCQRYELDGGLDHLVETWVEPGDVRVVMKDLAFIGEDSITAAEASQCVWEQAPERWAAWKQMIFTNQGPEREAWATQDRLVAMTEAWDGGIDAQALDACIGDHRYHGEVQGDIQEARAIGVGSTPTLVIGDQRVSASSTDAVDRIIAEHLAALGASDGEA